MRALPYKRAARVGGQVFEVVANVCHNELSDPRLKGVQITGVDMADNLKIASVFFYVEGGEEKRKKCTEGLASAKGYIKRSISQRLELRFIPEIRFCFDEAMENAERMDELLDELNRNGEMGE